MCKVVVKCHITEPSSFYSCCVKSSKAYFLVVEMHATDLETVSCKIVKHSVQQTQPSRSTAATYPLSASCAMHEINETRLYVSNSGTLKIKLCGPFCVEGIPTN